MWNYSALKSGVNLFELLIEDLMKDSENYYEDENNECGNKKRKNKVIWTVLSKKRNKGYH